MSSVINQIYTYEGSSARPSLLDVTYKQTGVPKPVIVFCHGFKGYKDWGCFTQMATYFAEEGFAVLKFNFSHNGGTVEQPIDFPDLEAFSNNNFSRELEDLTIIIDRLERGEFLPVNEADTSKIYLIGHSRGGGIALLQAARDARIKKVATLAAVSDFSTRFKTEKERELWKKAGVHYIENARTQQQMPLKYSFWEDFAQNAQALDIPAAVKRLQIPLCIVHGSADPTVDVEEARNLHAWNPSSNYLELNEADHAFGCKQPWESSEIPADFKKALEFVRDFFGGG